MKFGASKQWLGVVLILLAALGLWSSSGGVGSLLKRATRAFGPNAAFNTDQTYSGYFAAKYHYSFKHFWLSEDQLFLNYNLEHNQLTFRAFKWDVVRRAETPLSNLEALFDETNAARPFLWEMSPDGRWLLTVRTELPNVVFAVMDLQGVVARTWTNRWMNTRPVWLSHSHALMEHVFDDGNYFARVYRLDSPRIERLSLDIPSGMAPREFGVKSMAVLPESSQPDLIELVSFEFPETNTVMQKFALRVPRELRESDWTVFPSPGGDRLAWLAFYRQKVPLVALQRSFPFIEVQPRYVGCVWVSNTDGTEVKEIGRLRQGEEVRRLSWLPNGRHLSFVLRERIWVVPVE